MYNSLERLNKILSMILCFIAFLFIICGLIKVYQGDDAIGYFLLGGCFGIISTGKKYGIEKRITNQRDKFEFVEENYAMKIYDISQEVFACQVYPGDPVPERKMLKSMEKGESHNLTAFNMCAHNGTHIDAPFHFIKDGKTVDEIRLEAFVGMAYVVEHHGIITCNDAAEIIEKAKKQSPEATKRILIKGDVEVSLEAAKVFASSDILLLGNEPQTIGPQSAPMAVHLTLLGANVILLEGIRLSEVSEGVYFLNAAPLNLSGADGSPCRAVLIDLYS